MTVLSPQNSDRRKISRCSPVGAEIMRIRIISFTDRGYELGCRIKEALTSHESELTSKCKAASLAEICRSAFEQSVPLVFIGASGIAVRSIAPFIKDKLTDPPVLDIDELGRYVIPLLSGHAGGANELAAEIAEAIGAVPVITTATDINGAFPVDVFARENGLTVVNRDGIARVSTAALEGRPVTISIQDYPPAEHVDVLITDRALTDAWAAAGGRTLRDAASIILSPKKYAVGMGCRRGKSFEELRDFALKILDQNGISRADAGCIATIDIKKDEEGLKALSQAWRVPLITFDAELLAKVPGKFSSSDMVLEKTGVDNVCERAAVLAAGPGAELIVSKTAENGMTAAVASVKRK